MNSYLVLLGGIACAGLGGELFVRGTVGVARSLRVSAAIIGVSLAAMATSSPELAVSLSAAVNGLPMIGIGDSLGSNIINVAVILAFAVLILGINCPRDVVKRDFSFALLIPVITVLLLIDSYLSRLDGCVLLGLYLTWLATVVIEAHKQRRAAEIPEAKKHWGRTIVCLLAGLVLLMLAGRLIVISAKEIAVALGVSEFIIGATIVACGTSVPELATYLVAMYRGHGDIGLGTILGSNILNGALILGLVAIISPIPIKFNQLAVILLFGLLAVVLTYPTRQGLIPRRRAIFLFLLYAVYLVHAAYHP